MKKVFLLLSFFLFIMAAPAYATTAIVNLIARDSTSNPPTVYYVCDPAVGSDFIRSDGTGPIEAVMFEAYTNQSQVELDLEWFTGLVNSAQIHETLSIETQQLIGLAGLFTGLLFIGGLNRATL